MRYPLNRLKHVTIPEDHVLHAPCPAERSQWNLLMYKRAICLLKNFLIYIFSALSTYVCMWGLPVNRPSAGHHQ